VEGHEKNVTHDKKTQTDGSLPDCHAPFGISNTPYFQQDDYED
jgi:hypothetical protein